MTGAARLGIVLAALVVFVLGGCDRSRQRLTTIDEAPELPPPADELEAAIRRRAPSEALLMVPHEPPVRGELAQGQRRDFTAVLRSGLCYKVLAEGGAGVGDLDLVAYDPNGVLLQRDATQHAHPALGIDRAICPVEPGVYRFEVRMALGNGPYAAQVWVSQ